ncbi:hypothetical protein A6K76_08855 [Caryophanon latum]|uniref:Uncharacterized protein n=1 Tax=Caryophanon latum TaxID=33977 RepID=A0A1C0YWA9_9BACL|nr:hypothetical protein A6K76_08855 [Caryophanon latum]
MLRTNAENAKRCYYELYNIACFALLVTQLAFLFMYRFAKKCAVTATKQTSLHNIHVNRKLEGISYGI